MGKKVIITGSTGMVGRGVLLECLQSPHIDSVLVINRKNSGLTNPNLKEVICEDFFNLEPFNRDLKGYDACFFCLGISSFGMSEEDYTKITYDLTKNFAKTLLEINKNMTFCYVSGAGTDSSEKGSIMWARVKGRTENYLLKSGFEESYMFRPGFIQPVKGVRSKTKLYSVIYTILKPFYSVLKYQFKLLTTEIVGKAMIEVAVHGTKKNILKSRDIYILGRGENR